MTWKEKLQAVRESGQKSLDHQAEVLIEENWPRIQLLFEEKVGPAALTAARDDQMMESLFKLVYAALPFPVHMAVQQGQFVRFCFDHRDRLLLTNSGPARAAAQ